MSEFTLLLASYRMVHMIQVDDQDDWTSEFKDATDDSLLLDERSGN